MPSICYAHWVAQLVPHAQQTSSSSAYMVAFLDQSAASHCRSRGSGGRGRGSGNGSKQNLAASASHGHSLKNAVSDENNNPGAHVTSTAVAEQEHDMSADASLGDMGTDDSDILEQLPLAERLAEKQHQQVLADAAVRSRSKSPALDLPTPRAVTLAGQSCHHVAMGVPDPAAAASAGAHSAHHLVVAGALPAADGLAAVAAVKAVTKNGGRAAWARPLPRPSPAPAGPHLPSPAASRLQQGIVSTPAGASRADGTPAQYPDDRAPASSVQATSMSLAAVAVPNRCASGEQQPDQAANLQAEQPSPADVDGKQPAAEATCMKFLIDIDDSPAPAPADQYSGAPSGLSSHHNHGPPQLVTTKPQHSRLQLNSCTAPELAAGPRTQGHQLANTEAGKKPQQEPAETATRASMPCNLGSPCVGPLPTDSMTVPDTPPYSSNSQAGSPMGEPRSGPTWLSPLLARHQPGQGRLYSPSMLGRPHGMHLATITVEATAATQPPAGPAGVSASGNQALPEVSLPLSHSDKTDARSAAAFQAGTLPNASAVKLGSNDVQKAWKHAATRQAHPVPEAKSPGDGIMAAATGVFADWNSQEAADAADVPGAAPSQAPIPDMSPHGTTQVVVPGIAQISLQAPRATSSIPASPDVHCLRTQIAEEHVTSILVQGDDNSVLAPVNAVSSTAQELAVAASQPACRPQLTDPSLLQTDAKVVPAASGCEAVTSDQAADVSLATQAVDTPASTGKPGTSQAGEEVLQGICTSEDAQAAALPGDSDNAQHSQRDVLNGGSQHSDGNADDLHAYENGDSWDWQPTQGNFGYQDAFGASQSSQGWGLLDSWGNSHKPAWQKQQQAEADKPLVISSLPALGHRPAQLGFQAGPNTASEALPAARHMPFSNKRIPLPATKPLVQTKQPRAAPAQLQEAPALPLRSRPLPNSASGSRTAPGPLPNSDSQSVAASARCAAAHSPASAQINTQAAQPSLSKSPHQSRLLPCNQSTSTSGAGPVDQSYEQLRPAGHEISGQHAAANRSGPVTAGSGWSDATAAANRGKAAATAAAVNGHSLATVTAAVDSSRVEPRLAVPSSSSRSTAVANRATASTTANPSATSPAAAIFGPHIAAATSSQPHARKKLCLRLGPRQPDAAPAASPPVPLSSYPEHQRDTDRQAREQCGAGTKVAPDMVADQAGPDANRQQGARGRQEAYADTCVCVLSPEAATPAGKPTGAFTLAVCVSHCITMH